MLPMKGMLFCTFAISFALIQRYNRSAKFFPKTISEATVCNKTMCDEKTMLMCYCIRDNGERRGNSYPVPQSGNCKEPIQNCSVCYKVGIVFGCSAGAQFCYTDAILDAGPPPKLHSICPLSTSTTNSTTSVKI